MTSRFRFVVAVLFAVVAVGLGAVPASAVGAAGVGTGQARPDCVRPCHL